MLHCRINITLTLALISLFSETPKEVLTKGTERWLTKEFRYKFVSFWFVNPENGKIILIPSKIHYFSYNFQSSIDWFLMKPLNRVLDRIKIQKSQQYIQLMISKDTSFKISQRKFEPALWALWVNLYVIYKRLQNNIHVPDFFHFSYNVCF